MKKSVSQSRGSSSGEVNSYPVVPPISSPAPTQGNISKTINSNENDQKNVQEQGKEKKNEANKEGQNGKAKVSTGDLKLPTMTDDHYFGKMVPEITTRMNRLSAIDDFVNKECLDDINFLQCASRIGTMPQKSKVGDMLASLGVAELFQRIWEKYFDMDFLSDKNKLMGAITTGILIVMWNFTDKSRILCEKVYQKGLQNAIMKYLGSKYLEPSKTSQLTYKRMVSGLMGVLHNMLQKVPESSQSLRELKAVEVFQQFRGSPNDVVACKALILQGYMITEKENEIVNSDDSHFLLMKKILENALKSDDHYGKAYGFSAIEIISALNRLAVNDKNQIRIINAGLLPLYVKLLQPGCSEAEQAAAAEGLWTLEFMCMREVENEPGCVTALQNLVDTSADDRVIVQAKGALWKLQESKGNNQIHKVIPKSDGGHVFISYQWDSKPTIVKLADSLKSAGYEVWVDFDKMSGSILEAMADAVEKAVTVIVCLSQRYKESPNCRTEAEYTFRLHKDIIALRLQPRYYPDGWLGALVGNKLVFDFSNWDKYDVSFKNLVKELGGRGKAGRIEDVPKSVSTTRHHVTTVLGPSHEHTSNSAIWSVEEVNKWLQNNKIEHLQNWLRDVDGSLLTEYKVMRKNAPETFYSMLRDNGFSLLDILRLNRAMNQL